MITSSFDPESRPIISLREFYGEPGDLADVCVITFSHVLRDEILAARDCAVIAQIGACNGNIPIYGFRSGGRRVAFYLSPIGSTMASQCLLEANWLTGATKFISFGSAGSLDAARTSNRLILPTAAYRDEGMSYHYAPPADYIEVKNEPVLRALFTQLGLPFTEGRIWTTDAVLRETVGQMNARRAEGCIAVEMEIAGLQSVCDFTGLGLYSFIVTGDVLSEESYSVSGLTAANHNLDCCRLALEIAERI